MKGDRVFKEQAAASLRPRGVSARWLWVAFFRPLEPRHGAGRPIAAKTYTHIHYFRSAVNHFPGQPPAFLPALVHPATTGPTPLSRSPHGVAGQASRGYANASVSVPHFVGACPLVAGGITFYTADESRWREHVAAASTILAPITASRSHAREHLNRYLSRPQSLPADAYHAGSTDVPFHDTNALASG